MSNIIIRDNSYYLIDNEWTLEGNLPVSFIFFRGLLSFYNKHRFEEVLLNRIFKYYKFPDKLIQVYYDMEKDFQYHVYGENLQNKNKYLKKVEKIKDIKKLIEEKDKEIKNQSNWINICQEEVKKRDENVRLLQKEFEEKEKWIAICQEEIKKRDDNTKSLLNTLEDKANYINFLIIQLIEKEAHINTLTHEITEKKSHINNLNHQLTEWNYQITEKETHINNLNHQLTEVYNNIKIASTTKAWKLMCFIRRIKEQLLAGNMGQKKSFLKWIKNKLLKQTVPEELALARFSPINFIPQFFVPAENKLTPRKKIEKTENSSVNVSDNKGSSVQTYDVIFFSIINWDTRYQRPNHLAAGLRQKGHRIFYISVNLFKTYSYSYREINKHIYELTLPYYKDVSIYNEDINNGFEILKIAFDNIYRDFSIKESIAFVEFPTWYSAVKYLKESYNSKVVFDVLDEFSGFSNIHKDINCYQDMLISISDLCIATSRKIFNDLKTKTECIKTIPNATEFEYFSILPENNILSNIKKPVIGYYGAIAEWFDIDLIEYTALKHPEWSLVLIGSTWGSDAEKLKPYENIYLPGEMPYKELTKYLYWFDVCLIPFKICALILSTNPVKFYEYISSGKPVVSTNLPELEPYKELLYISHTKEEFVENIELALKESDEKIKKRRIETARNNDWKHRVEELENSIINIFLEGKVSEKTMDTELAKFNPVTVDPIHLVNESSSSKNRL